MVALRIDRTLLLVLLACIAIFGLPRTSVGQTEERTPTAVERAMDVDVEVELHLLVASNAAESGKLPASLEAVARKMRASLPFTNYRLGASFLSRVKNGKQLNTKGVGRSLLVSPNLESSVLPTFYEISSAMVNLKPNGAGSAVVQFSLFRFGLRIPLQLGSTGAKDGTQSTPSVQYEWVGITTDVTMREGEAIVVGTMDVGRPNETLVLVLVATRTSVGN